MTTIKLNSVEAVKAKPLSARQQKAAATRRRMLDAAYELFCDGGYNQTTMGAIAERAGVAVQTLYFTFHTKDELLQEVHDRTVLGDDGLPPALQPWYRAAVAEPDLAKAVRLIVDGTSEIFARVAPMLPVFHTVAAEPAGVVWQRAERLRLDGFGELLSVLEDKHKLRRGLTHAEGRDILFVVLSPQTFGALVHDRGWGVARWRSWTVSALLRELFGVEAGSQRTPSRPRRKTQ